MAQGAEPSDNIVARNTDIEATVSSSKSAFTRFLDYITQDANVTIAFFREPDLSPKKKANSKKTTKVKAKKRKKKAGV